jgi:hypothetical protein
MTAKKRFDEQVIQEFSHRCPYCEQPISYEDLHLQPGENEIICPSCNRTYIKIVPWKTGSRGEYVK